MGNSININGRRIGEGASVYVVAELSANHNQNFDRAVSLIEEAKNSGADAIKLQTYTPETITMQSDREYFRVKGGTLWDGQTLFGLYKESYMPWDWHSQLQEIAADLGIDLFSTPFDSNAVDFLESLDVPAYKVASFEIVDLPLIERVAATGKPIIISTGMATLAEIDEAVFTARNAGARQIMLLKCNSAYPTPPEEMNLLTIPNMSQAFDLPVGLSDHTVGIAVPVAAVALGACMIEKHFTLSRGINSPDREFSLEPHEFRSMVEAVRIAEKALGKVSYQVTEHEKASRDYRRSLFIVKDVKLGDEFTTENVQSIRPAHGLHTRYLSEIIGRRASCDIEMGTPLSWSLIGGD